MCVCGGGGGGGGLSVLVHKNFSMTRVIYAPAYVGRKKPPPHPPGKSQSFFLSDRPGPPLTKIPGSAHEGCRNYFIINLHKSMGRDGIESKAVILLLLDNCLLLLPSSHVLGFCVLSWFCDIVLNPIYTNRFFHLV